MSNRAYAQYSISDIRDGVDGVGILSIEEQYCKTTTAATPSESYSGWSTSQPEYEANAYIWTRSKITWDNEITDPNHITYTDPVLATTYKTLYTDVINKILDIATEDENGNWSLTQGVIENTYAYTDPNTSQPVSLSQIGASITTSKNGILQTVSNTYATQTSLNSEINARKATYVTSSTNTGTAAKIGVCSNFELYNGAVITCLFTQANTTVSPTLNVNGTGAIAIKASDGSNLSEAQYKWSAGSSFTLVYVEQSSTKKYWRLQDSNILTRFDVAETTIDQTANNILIKATKTNATNSDKQAGGQAVIESLINVAPQGIKISADKVNIEGAAIFTSGRLSTTNLNSTIDGRIPEIPDDLSDLTDSTGIVPTKVSDLTNDSNFQTDSDVSGTIVSATTLYYASNSATPPSKPTAHISTNNTGTRGQWNIALPTYNASYPYLYICTENQTKGGTYSWTSVEQTTYTSAISSIKSTAEAAAPKTSAIAEEQRIYYRSKVNTKPNGNGLPTTWVTETGNKYNTNATTSAGWSRKITPISTGTSDTTKYLYLWTCIQKKTVSGTVTYGDILLDDSTTVIDGGNIVTGTITANQIAATAITTQKLAADAIKSANYDAGPTNSPYSSGGTFLDLTTGNIYTPNFGVQSTTGQAYLNGQIIATSGTIGDDSGNYWSIGNTTDAQGDTSASIIGNGTAYIQDGDFQIHNGVSNYSKGSINTQWYTTPSGGGLQITYPYYNSKYYDYGMTSPILNTSDSRYYNQTVSQNFLYIRKSPSNAIPTVASDWQYLFRVDKDGIAYVSNLYVNGTDIATMISNGVDGGAYLSTSGGTVDGDVIITGTLTATASKAINDSDGLQINSTYVKKSGSQMSDSGYISRNGKSVSWHKGRDGALIKTISINAYSPLASLKTTNGSWDIGVYNNSSYYDDLLFTYVTDTLYGGINTVFTKQIKFLENGHIVADGFDGKATSAGTADSATTATTSTWTTLIKPIADTTTASASTWSIPSGSKQVWGERFSDSTLKYTPSGGSATTITDTGDLVLFLTPNATSNLVTLNMKIDGTYYGSFSGNLTGTASSATTATKFSSNRTIELTGDTTGSASTNGESGWSIATTTSVLNGGTALTSKNLNDYHDASGKLHFYYAAGGNSCTNVPIGDGTQFGLITYNSASGHITQEISSFSTATNKGKWIRWWNSSSWSNWEKFITNAFAGSAPSNIGTTASAGTSENYARQDHVHKIDLATGDSNGQVKIAGSNVSVKGLAALAYKASLAKSDVGLGSVDNAQQVRALSSGTTSGHLVTWGANGYTVADSGISLAPSGNTRGIVSGVSSNSSGQLVLTYADGSTSSGIDVEFVATQTSSVQKAEALNVNGKAVGSATVPVYFNENGKPQTANTIPKLNNTTTGGVFYAPTSTGSSGQVLTYPSSGSVPVWTNQSSLNVGSATTATKLTHTTLNNTTLHNTAGTFAFSGSGDPWANTDWVGLQVGDNVDKFQIAANSNTLVFRQNDSGGTNTSWSDWVTMLTSGNYTNYTVTKTGGGASGTWGISISGNAATATTATTATKATQDGNGKNINDTYVKKTGDTMSADLNFQGSTNDSPDIVWKYSDGTEKMRIWAANEFTSKAAPSFREYKADGTQLYSGNLVLGDGTGASGTWGISISGNAATATKATNDSDNNPINTTYLKLVGGTMTGLLNFPMNTQSVSFRPGHDSYDSGFVYGTSGNECLSLVQQNQVTSFMVVHGSDPSTWNSGTWTTATPTIQTKYKSLYVNELIANGVTPEFNFKVNGTSYFGGSVKISHNNTNTEGISMIYDNTHKCLNFIFN